MKTFNFYRQFNITNNFLNIKFITYTLKKINQSNLIKYKLKNLYKNIFIIKQHVSNLPLYFFQRTYIIFLKKYRRLGIFFEDTVADNVSIFETIESFFLNSNFLLLQIFKNNAFASFSSVEKKQVLNFSTAGMLDLKISPRSVKNNVFSFIKRFLKSIYKQCFSKVLFFILRIPKQYRKRTFKLIRKALQLLQCIFLVDTYSIFNGCRGKKLRRKKHVRHYLH